MVFDPDGTVRWGLTEAVYYSGEWNEAFQALLAKAVPEANVRLYTAHSLRVGGITAGAQAGLSVQQLATCAAHRSLDTTKIYIRDSLDTRRKHFARIGGQRADSNVK